MPATMSLVIEFQDVMLSLLFGLLRTVSPPLAEDTVDGAVDAFRVEVEVVVGVGASSCILIVSSVFRTNCALDILLCNSAMCKSVFKRSREYDTA